MNNLEIGGRNLALKSATNYSCSMFNQSASTLAGYNDYVLTGDVYNSAFVAKWSGSSTSIYSGPYFEMTTDLGVTLEIGETYTISAWMKADNETTIRQTNLAESNTILSYQNVVRTSWTRVWTTFIANATGCRVGFYTNTKATEEAPYIYMCGIKVEKGNKPTDWTPAPEDVQNDILNAAKTATNFMSFSNAGLVIGDMTTGTLGENVLIDSNSVDIRNGTTTLASFGADTIYLGKNAETSVINLCNGAATMRVKDDTDFRIYTDKRLVMSAYSSMLLDCWRDSTHMTRIAIQSSDPDVSSVVGGVQFTIYQDNIQNTVQMLGNDIIHKVTDGTNETYTTMNESIFKVNTSGTIVLNSSSSIQIGDSSSYSFGLRLGSTFTKNKSINCYWSDGEVHDLLSQSANGQTCYLGAGDIGDVTNTNIRGKYVRLYAHDGGGVYLGYSGSTAITSDRNMKKDIIDIDGKYIDFFDRLRPITYKYNVGHRDHIGFVAQEVEEALLESGLTTEQFAGLVIERDITINPNYDSSLSDEENKANETHYDTLYSLRYEEFISLIVKKVQDLQRQVNELKGE